MLNAIEDFIMVNQINDSGNMKPIEQDSRLKAKSKETEQPAVENAAIADSVSFSDTSKQLEAIKASFKDIPEVNEARVSKFKMDIEAGNYQIDSNQIARKMLNSLEMA